MTRRALMAVLLSLLRVRWMWRSRSCLWCPVCGRRVIMIFWEWPSAGPVTAEYHHWRDVDRFTLGLPPELHTMAYTWDEATAIRFAPH